MSIELTVGNFGSSEIFYDNAAEQGIDCDISLPDYCPDVVRILKCSLQNSITDSKISGDRATADGNAKIRIIYSDEHNGIYCYEQDYPFSKYAELPSPFDNAVLDTRIKTDYVNCRAVSKRRIDVHGVVSIRFKVSGKKNDSFVSDACGDGIQLKRKGFDVADTVACEMKIFQLSEVESVGEHKPGVGKILNVCAAPVLSESKLIKGKILIKGELAVKVLYCSDEGENEACEADFSLPFNEIIESENVTDECTPDASVCVRQITAEQKTDNEGEFRYININAELAACVTACRQKSIRVITDAYSTETEIDAQYKQTDFVFPGKCVRDDFMLRESLDLSSLSPQKLFAVIAEKPECKCSFTADKMKITGKIPVGLIVNDSQGMPIFCEREANIDYSCPVESVSDGSFCEPRVEMTGYSCTLGGDGKADFKAELNIAATVMSTRRERVITSLKADETADKKKRNPSLTVYFCSGSESVWDIARQYNTTVDDIMQENNLKADYLENKTMLLIPIK